MCVQRRDKRALMGNLQMHFLSYDYHYADTHIHIPHSLEVTPQLFFVVLLCPGRKRKFRQGMHLVKEEKEHNRAMQCNSCAFNVCALK